MRVRRWLAGGLAVGMLATTLWAKTGVIKTRDGQTYTGDVSEDPDSGDLVVTVHGIPMRLERRNVASLDYVDNDADAFKKKLAALDPNNVHDRLEMARQAFNSKQYDLAELAADSAQKADPNSRDVADFQLVLRRTQAMEHGGTQTTTPPPAKDPTKDDILIPQNPGTPAGGAGMAPPKKLLGADDINTIKQMEISASDQDFRVSITNAAKAKYLEKEGGTAAEFSRLSPQDQARNILMHQPALRNDVKIQGDPIALAGYKKSVQPALLAGCATSGCHGGMNAGNFVLFSPAANEAETYTNFYILAQYAKTVNKVPYQMFDRTTPDKSLVLQFGLPADAANVAHPAVTGYRSVYKSVNDPKYKAALDWLTNTLQPVVPDYGIKYTPPTGTSPTTAPAGK